MSRDSYSMMMTMMMCISISLPASLTFGGGVGSVRSSGSITSKMSNIGSAHSGWTVTTRPKMVRRHQGSGMVESMVLGGIKTIQAIFGG